MTTRVVTFHYVLKDKDGTELDASTGKEPMSYLEGTGQIIPGLEESLKALKVGDKKTIAVKAKDAYGEPNADLVFEVPRTNFPKTEKIEVGMRFQAQDPNGMPSPVFIVKSIGLEKVTLDGNHPLAGQDLFFDVEVTEARAATKDELSHGHSHSGGAHSHGHDHSHDHDDHDDDGHHQH